jgi:hypothetical protein
MRVNTSKTLSSIFSLNNKIRRFNEKLWRITTSIPYSRIGMQTSSQFNAPPFSHRMVQQSAFHFSQQRCPNFFNRLANPVACTAFNLMCCCFGLGSLSLARNYADAGPKNPAPPWPSACASSACTHPLASPVSSTSITCNNVWWLGILPHQAVPDGIPSWLPQFGTCLMLPIAFFVLGGTILPALFERPHWMFASCAWPWRCYQSSVSDRWKKRPGWPS